MKQCDLIRGKYSNTLRIIKRIEIKIKVEHVLNDAAHSNHC